MVAGLKVGRFVCSGGGFVPRVEVEAVVADGRGWGEVVMEIYTEPNYLIIEKS